MLSCSIPLCSIEWPMSKSEWIGLVRQQLEGHDEEMRHWHSTLSSLVESLEQVRRTDRPCRQHRVSKLESSRLNKSTYTCLLRLVRAMGFYGFHNTPTFWNFVRFISGDELGVKVPKVD